MLLSLWKITRLPTSRPPITEKPKKMKPIVDHYETALKNIPPPGAGCHSSLLSVANLGVLAGVPGSRIAEDIRANIPRGQRQVRAREIEDAVSKAMREVTPLTDQQPQARQFARRPPSPPKLFDGPAYRRKLIDRSAGCTEAEIWEASPCRIDWEPGAWDSLAVLSKLYAPSDVLFVGGVYDRQVQTVKAIIDGILKGVAVPPHVIPNPLDGNAHETSSGDKASFRCDAAVQAFRFAVVEFDDMPRCDQVSFWFSILSGGLLPVAALIDSAGKSIHAWLRVDLPDVDAWRREIREGLYHPETGRMTLLGADRACQNPSRLSRMPGALREDKGGAVQRLLYLNPGASS